MEYNELMTYQKVENILKKLDSLKLELEDVLCELNPKDPDLELEKEIQSKQVVIDEHNIE